MNKQQLLDQVAGEIAATNGGPFGPGLNPVPGEGNPNSETLWIGEAPGYHEDKQGRPFVGVSGQLLRKTMAENGFPPETVYITNIVKFRPPENRDPIPQEIEFFRPFLDKQIEIIDPKIIVTVGRFSMYKFLGEGVGISKIHGVPRQVIWNGRKIYIFPMFHSAAALRDGNVMKMFREDFKKLKNFVESLDNPQGVVVEEVKPNVETLPAKQMELI